MKFMDNLFDFIESFRKLIVTSNFPKVGVESVYGNNSLLILNLQGW